MRSFHYQPSLRHLARWILALSTTSLVFRGISFLFPREYAVGQSDIVWTLVTVLLVLAGVTAVERLRSPRLEIASDHLRLGSFLPWRCITVRPERMAQLELRLDRNAFRISFVTPEGARSLFVPYFWLEDPEALVAELGRWLARQGFVAKRQGMCEIFTRRDAPLIFSLGMPRV